MFRVNGVNADAIGKEPEKPPVISENISESEFEDEVWKQMRTVYDPEIPINVVDLGLIYNCDIAKDSNY